MFILHSKTFCLNIYYYIAIYQGHIRTKYKYYPYSRSIYCYGMRRERKGLPCGLEAWHTFGTLFFFFKTRHLFLVTNLFGKLNSILWYLILYPIGWQLVLKHVIYLLAMEMIFPGKHINYNF